MELLEKQPEVSIAEQLVESQADKHRICNELSVALEKGGIGDIVDKHQQLIDSYYRDVLSQATQSFTSAKKVATIGFAVLIATVVYMVATDVLSRLTLNGQPMMAAPSIQVGAFGTISGVLIEFIAAINFVLYAKASKQFGAFHICLERAHRYLVAYKIADTIDANKAAVLEKLVCIMANAPMISPSDLGATQPALRTTMEAPQQSQ
jgi:TRADD-N domain-containing protein